AALLVALHAARGEARREIAELLPGDIALRAVLVGVFQHAAEPIGQLDDARVLEARLVGVALDVLEHQVGRFLRRLHVRRTRLGRLVLPLAVAARAGLRRAMLAARILL